jgi:predicted outer membrane repeat protein
VYVVSINEDIEIYNCEFLSNEAGTNGGAFALVNGNTNITFLRSSFFSNRAGKAGGAIYSALATIQWKAVSCLFQDNQAATYGGALSVANDNEYFTLRSCELIGNQANIGGAVYFGNTNNFIAIFASNLSHNHATSYGGGVVSLCANFAIYRSVLFSNSAVIESGGLHIAEATNTVISHTIFERNVASNGRGGGSTIIGYGSGDVLVANSRYLRNTATADGGAMYLSSARVLFVNNSCDSNQAMGSGGSLFATAITTLSVIGSEFKRSEAMGNGGAVSVTEVIEFILNTSSFLNNTSTGQLTRGSALYLSSVSTSATLSHNLFQDNSLLFGSGTVFWTYSTMSEPTHLSSNTFLRNSASYGSSVATEAYALFMTHLTVNVTDYGSGSGSSPISPPFSISLVDFYQQTVTTDSSSIVEFSIPSSSSSPLSSSSSSSSTNAISSGSPSCHNGAAYLTGGLIENYRSGVAMVSQLEAHCSPGEVITAMASTSLSEINSSPLFLEFQIRFRECYAGEIDSQGDCVACSEFYYSFDPSEDTQCRVCPENAVCQGGSHLSVQRGYWRQCQSCHVIEPCRLTDVCLGGENVSTQCRVGHTGPLCNLCEDGYALGADSKCSPCSSTSSTLPLILGPTLLLLSLLLLLVAYLKRDLLLLTLENLLLSLNKLIAKYHLNSFQTKLKILISFAQILTSLPTLFDVNYPLLFTHFLDILSFSNLNFLSLFSVGCLWKSTFYDSLLLYTLGPVLLALLLSLLLHLRHLLALRINQHCPSYSLQQRNEQIKLLFIFIAFLVFSPASVRIFQTFVCEEFEDGTMTLVADSSLSCGEESSQWKYYVTYASLMCLVYPLGIPLFYLFSLYSHLTHINPADLTVALASELPLLSQDIIQNEKIKYRQHIPRINGLSFLFASYLPRNWYFEVIECSRRLLLTSIPLLFLRSTSLQIVLVLLVSLVFCAVYQELRPFVNQSDNVVAIYSQWAITLTVLGSLCLRVDMTEEVSSFGPDAIGVLMTGLNVFVAILTLVAAIRMDGLGAASGPVASSSSPAQRPAQQKGEGQGRGKQEEELGLPFSLRVSSGRSSIVSENRRFSQVTWGRDGDMRRGAGGGRQQGDSDDDSDEDEGKQQRSDGRLRSVSRNPLTGTAGSSRGGRGTEGTIRGVELTEL